MIEELVLELCKYENYNREKIEKLLSESRDDPKLFGLLAMHRMCGMAYYILKECNLLNQLNREFRSSIKAIYEQNVYKTNSLKKGLDLLAQVFFQQANSICNLKRRLSV